MSGAGRSREEIGSVGVVRVRGFRTLVRRRDPTDFFATKKGFPAFAVPVLTKGEFSLAQTTAILCFLGEELGMMPTDAMSKADSMQLLGDAGDVWSESYAARTSGAPMAFIESGRLSKWMAHLTAALLTAAPNSTQLGPFFLGAAPTCADYALFSALRLVQEMYPTGFAAALSPEIKAWQEVLAARPAVAKYLVSCEPIIYESLRGDP